MAERSELKTNSPYIVTVPPGTNLQELINSHPGDTTFLIETGTHRLPPIRPKTGNSFIGKPGAILSGARELKDFTQHGSNWIASVSVTDIPQKGKCVPQKNGTVFNGCRLANDLFFNSRPLTQVMSSAQLESGKWFFDSHSRQVYISDNPINQKVEMSVTRYAMYGNSNRITIKNLTIEKFANPAQEGAIHPMNGAQGPLGKDWKVDKNEIRFNHGIGIRLGHRMRVTNNHVHHNGQLGVGGSGNSILIEGNQIAYNNTQKFDSHWEAGGTKFTRTRNLIVKHNFVHHNQGPGLWTDGHNIHTLYEGNKVFENIGPGIFHEISYEALIKDNVVEKNGFGFMKWVEGAGILISSSENVEIFGNTVKGNRHGICAIQTNRGSGEYGPFEIENLYVHDNHITMGTGQTGLSVQSQDISYFTSRKNRFKNNHYTFLRKKQKYFRWNNSLLTDTTWKKLGQDSNGSFMHID